MSNTIQSNLEIQCNPQYNPNGIFSQYNLFLIFLFFAKIEEKNPKKLTLDSQMTLNSQNNLEKENKAGGLILSHFKTHYKTTVIKTVWFCDKNRYIDQWNRIQNPEINLHVHDQLVLNKGAKGYTKGKSLFNKWCWKNWIFTCKIMKLDLYLLSYSKINS